MDKPDSAFLKRKMRNDLEYQFGIKAFAKKIRVPFMVLSSTGDNSEIFSDVNSKSYQNSSIYNITMQNYPINNLIDIFYRFQIGREFVRKEQRYIAIFDKTKIKHNITIDIKDINIRNLEELNRELKKFNLVLSKEERELDMIVITDK